MFNINDQPVSVIHIKKTFELQPHLQVYMTVNVRYIETEIFLRNLVFTPLPDIGHSFFLYLITQSLVLPILNVNIVP